MDAKCLFLTIVLFTRNDFAHLAIIYTIVTLVNPFIISPSLFQKIPGDKALGLESSSKKSVQEEKDIPLRRAAYNNMFLNFIIFVLNLIRNRI